MAQSAQAQGKDDDSGVFRKKLRYLQEMFHHDDPKPLISFDDEDAADLLSDFGLTSANGERGGSVTHKFLDTYTPADAIQYLKKYGIIEKLHKMGFHDLSCAVDDSDFFVHRLKVYDKEAKEENVLIDLIARRMICSLPDFKAYNQDGQGPHEDARQKQVAHVVMETLPTPIKVTAIEWLCLQNPRAQFCEQKPRLPGQKHPGLGVVKEFCRLLGEVAAEHGRDALLNVPEHYHNALMWHSTGSFFLNPDYQGFFLTLTKDLAGDVAERGLAAVSYAVAAGLVVDPVTRDSVPWVPQEMLAPLTAPVAAYAASRAYQDVVEEYTTREARLGHRYWVDWSAEAALNRLHGRAPSATASTPTPSQGAPATPAPSPAPSGAGTTPAPTPTPTPGASSHSGAPPAPE